MHQLQLRPRKNFAGGIIGRVDYDGFSLVVKRRPQLALVKRPLAIDIRLSRRTQPHIPRLRPRDNRIRPIVFVKRFEDDDLISRIAHRQQSGNDGLGRAAANREFGLGINRHPLPFLKFPGNGVAQTFRAPGDGVLIDVGGNRFLRRPLDLRRSREVRKALRQIDGVIHHRLPRHLANHGLSEVRDFAAEEGLRLRGYIAHIG